MAEPVDERIAALAEEYASKQEPLPQGRSGIVSRADLEATRLRIIHGVSKKEVDAAGEDVVPYPPAEEEM